MWIRMWTLSYFFSLTPWSLAPWNHKPNCMLFFCRLSCSWSFIRVIEKYQNWRFSFLRFPFLPSSWSASQLYKLTYCCSLWGNFIYKGGRIDYLWCKVFSGAIESRIGRQCILHLTSNLRHQICLFDGMRPGSLGETVLCWDISDGRRITRWRTFDMIWMFLSTLEELSSCRHKFRD